MFRDSSTEMQHAQKEGMAQGTSRQLLSEVDSRQSATTKQKVVEVRDTLDDTQKATRGRRPRAAVKRQVQQQEKGRHKTRKPTSTATEFRIRQQNKEAAIRCRRRKGQEEADLWSREKSLEDTNRQLTSYCNSLKEEVYYIKEQLLQHSGCNCTLIQEYIANEAKRSVGKLSSPDSAKLSHPSSVSAASPCEAGDMGSWGGSTEQVMSSPTDLESLKNVDTFLFQPLCSCYICQRTIFEVPVEQAFNELPLGNWGRSPDLDTMEQLDGDEAPWINTEWPSRVMSEIDAL